ncbi:MAG: hypothetical protein A2Z99_03450 [Treponema sp. GWB1_62_6]|nr:MAG: hypothetical protein A2Z99_03450 [Treponema sp. GWB1_62_6]
MQISPRARIVARSLSYSYPASGRNAVDSVDLEIHEGEYLALLGANGSGKSTLLKLLVGLLEPDSGSVRVFDETGRALDPSEVTGKAASRRVVGVVLQNPDDQIIGAVVEADAAFGPLNAGMDPEEVARRVDAALHETGLEKLRTRPPQFLSGGEKQRLVIAGVLALSPPVLALDEAASMIDPAGREALLDLLDELVAGKRTVLHVTHSLDEAARARRVVVLHQGAVVFDGEPRALFARGDLEAWGFVPNDALAAASSLRSLFPDFRPSRIDPVGFVGDLLPFLTPVLPPAAAAGSSSSSIVPEAKDAALPAFAFSGATRAWLPRTAYAARGIQEVDFALPAGRSLALVGATGSGKSTVLRHCNAILLPNSGEVRVLGVDTAERGADLRALRFRVPLSVQNPEAALFERFVADDVAWGPRNKGLTGRPLLLSARSAMEKVGLSWDEFRDRETRSLSGGEKRKAALAGCLAMEGEASLFDEPTAALDGVGRRRVLDLVLSQASTGVTTIATTHSMEEASRFDFVGVMSEGSLVAFGPPREVFSTLWKQEWGLRLPWAAEAARLLQVAGALPPCSVLDAEDLVSVIAFSRAFPLGTGKGKKLRSAASDPAVTSVPDVPAAVNHAVKRRRRRGRSGVEFFRNATIGQFLDRPSALRSLKPGTKLFALLTVVSAALLAPDPLIAFGLLAITLFVAHRFGRIGPAHLLRGLLPAWPFIALMVLAQLLFAWPGDSGPVIASFGPIDFTVPELLRSGLLLVRMAVLMASLALFSAVTPLAEASRAAGGALEPLARFGLPVRGISLSVGIAIRFVPVLVEEAERIVVAQISRGGVSAGKARPRAALALIVPLFLRALERAESLAVAMELRGFSEAGRKT